MGGVFALIAFLVALCALIGILIPADVRGVLIVLMFLSLAHVFGGSISIPFAIKRD